MAASSASTQTFADMARRFCPSDNGNGSEQSSQSPAAGIIKLQPHRKIGQDPWRPMQTSELSVACENASSTAENMERLLHVSNSAPPTYVTNSPEALRYNHSNSKFENFQERAQHSLKAKHTDSFSGQLYALDIDQTRVPTKRQTGINDRYTELFGDLPDQIHLQEVLGEFDGQVIFIGHPNRDVSAHQWSSASFQWESIGRYSHSRDRVEGSLASERVSSIDISDDALLHFKYAAEDREKHVAENQRPEAVGIVRSMFAEIVRRSETPQASIAISQEVSKHNQVQERIGRSSGETVATIPEPLHDFVQKEHLDDPFVAKTDPVPDDQFDQKLPQNSLVDAKGSLDLRYEFPAPPRPSDSKISRDIVQRQDDSAIPRHRTRLAHPNLLNIRFGGEASNGFASSDAQNTIFHKQQTVSSPAEINVRPKPVSHVSTNAEYVEHLEEPVQRRITPRFEGLQPTARSLFPDKGLTVANPYRNVSRLDTTAPTVSVASIKAPASERRIDSTNTTVLRFSDPDVLQQGQEHEIANGLSQQPPTPQNFKGPFFTESKPTANDPTASLSIHESDEEKLRNWYGDGHRPARQREYALTLMGAAAAGNRRRHPGAIGDPASIVDKSQTNNTVPFVRLYEGLSEYIEEYRNGSGGSYFTRAWKVAPTNLRNLGPDGNNSFFSSAGTTPGNYHLQVNMQFQEEQAQSFKRSAPSGNTMTFPPFGFGTVGDRGRVSGKVEPHISTRWGF